MHRIVIVGGGFGGVRAALNLSRRLGKEGVVTLIDKNAYHLFSPSLYEVASAYRSDTDLFSLRLRRAVAIPFRDIFQGTGVQLVQGMVTQINPAGQTVHTQGGQVWEYDYLILGPGNESADFGIPGVRDYAYRFKSIDDALMTNQRLQTIFDEARHGQRTVPLHIVVVGGGFTGVELAAEVASCAAKLARICSMEQHCFYVTIVESGKVMKVLNEREQHIMRTRLTQLGVALEENVRVEEVTDGTVKLSDGRKLTSDMTIWATGTQSNALVRVIPGLELGSRGKVTVDPYLRVVGAQNIFAVGDVGEFINPRTKATEAEMAYVAIEHGATAARNIVARIMNRPLRTHIPPGEVWVAPVGGKYALAHLWGGISLTGFLAWVLREVIDLRYFLSILPARKAFNLFWHQTHEFTKND